MSAIPTKISVIMLTYNREKMVDRAIKSILQQTFHDFEFIVVDNGSTDRSGEICDCYAKTDSRMRVIHRTAGNIGSGRNTGLNAASGEYIAFIDDDDWVEPDFLQFLYDLAIRCHADVSICGFDKEENGKIDTVQIQNDLLVMNAEQAVITLMWRRQYNNAFPTKLFQHGLFDGLRFPEEGCYDDIALMYKVLANATRVASRFAVKYHLYRHPGNNSAATTHDCFITKDYLTEYRKDYSERTIWLCEKFPDRKDYWYYFDWSFQISMVHKIISFNLTECLQHLHEMQKELAEHRDEFLTSPYILDFEKEWMNEYV